MTPSAAQNLEKSLWVYQQLASHSGDIILFVASEDRRIIDANEAAVAAYGYSREELQSIGVQDLRVPEAPLRTAEQLAEADSKGVLFETVHRRKDGSSFPVEVNSQGVTIDGQRILISIIRDITARKQTERELRRSNRALATLSKCNHALVHATSETELLQQICDTVIQAGGHRLAWVGFPEGDARRPPVPAAKAGFDDGYLQTTTLIWSDVENPDIPTVAALRTGTTQVVHDALNHPNLAPLRDEIRRRRYVSMIALPLLRDSVAFGVLVINSADPEAFDESEVELLEELAGNLAFGIVALRNAERRKRAEAALRDSEERYRLLFAKNPLPMWILDRASLQILEVNDAALQHYGYSRREFLGMNTVDLAAPGYVDEMLRLVRIERDDYAFFPARRHHKKDGSEIEVDIESYRFTLNDQKVELVLSRDVTERIRAEKQLKATTARLEAIFQHAPIGIVVGDNQGRPLEFNDAIRKMLGYSSEELHRMHFADFSHPDDVTREMGLFRELMGGQRTRYELEKREIRKDGSTLWCNVISSVMQARTESDDPVQLTLTLVEDITERKRIDEELRQSELRLRRLFESNSVGMFFGEMDGGILDCNSALLSMLGYSREDLAGGLSWQKLIAPESQHLIRHNLEELRATGAIRPTEKQFLRKDGSRVPVVVSVATYDEARQRSVVLVLDLSESKKAQEAIARLAAIVESSEDAIIGIAKDTTITDWNRGATRLFGYSREEATGQPIGLLAPGNRLAEVAEISRRADSGEKVQLETVRRRKDGTLVDVSISVSPILAKDGRVVGFSTLMQDITGRKVMEKALRQSEERFKLAVQATRDLLWDWDLVTGAMWRGDSYWEHFGFPRPATEPEGTEWIDRVHPEDRDQAWREFQDALRAGERFNVSEFRLGRADGSYATCVVRRSIVYDESGTPIRAIGTTSDVTEQRKLEEQFRQAQKLEALGRLTGGVAHDFNNLLMVISGYTQLLEERLEPEDPQRKNTQAVLEAARRASGLTQQLLAFSRKQVLVPEVTSLNAVVQDAAKMVARLLGEDIELGFQTDPFLWDIKIDPSQITQVILNLVVNARDAMPHGGKLTLETANVVVDSLMASRHSGFVPGEYVMLAVSDTGVGMTKDIQAQIFEPFFTTKPRGKGTGLGLSMVYGLVKQSGGFIWVYSEPGHGSCFKLYFPKLNQPVEPVAPPVQAGTLVGHGEIVLVVEDEVVLREAICENLRRLGYVVLHAGNGKEALELARYHSKIDLLLTDVIMPGMSGPQLAEQFRTLQPTPTLYMSGYTDEMLTDHGVMAPDTALIQKPFSFDDLSQVMRGLLDGTN